jgi:GrpB-like predicted nucleotidyltransferase (UPF0157 family)
MDDIEIVAYDPRWSALFEEEATRLRSTLGGEPIAGLEHFGSTAIPHLAAKPIIDILIAVPSLSAARAVFPAKLRTLNYVFWADNPKIDRLFFVKGMPPYGERRTMCMLPNRPVSCGSASRFATTCAPTRMKLRAMRR